jgi:phospholipase/carboxylesterase
VSTSRLDRDAVLWSSPERSPRSGQPLVVCLHGYHGSEIDLVPLLEALPLDRLVVASLRGPVPVGGKWAWASYAVEPTELDAASRAVLDWLGSVGSPTPVGIAGFSQGGAVAAHLLRVDPARVACAALLSGFVAAASLPGDAVLRAARPPVFSGHGLRDSLVEPFREETSRWLAAHTRAVEKRYADMGHALGGELARDAAEFLTGHLLA